MYGPPETFLADLQKRAHEADFETPRQELIDIVFNWPDLLATAARRSPFPSITVNRNSIICGLSIAPKFCRSRTASARHRISTQS